MDSQRVTGFIEEYIQEKGFFLVDIHFKPANKIQVYIDNTEGITIKECEELSRAFNGHFDRDKEDYDLQVSSPGLDMPLKVDKQFEKYLNRDVQVILNEGKKLHATLLDYSESVVKISLDEKISEKGRKKKKVVKVEKEINKSDIKAVKPAVSFK